MNALKLTPTNNQSHSQDPVFEGRRLITPEKAQNILDNHNFNKQRRVEQSTVRRYAESMRDGRWTPGTQLAFCKCDNQYLLVNGQHRLAAVALSGVSVEFQVLVNEVNSLDDVDTHYARHDCDIRKRSFYDVIRAVGVNTESGLPLRLLGNMPAASRVIENRFSDFRLNGVESAERRIDRIGPWLPVAREISDSLAGLNMSERVFTVGPLSVMLATVKYHGARATFFWKTSIEDDGLRKNDPRYHLVRYLSSHTVRSATEREQLARACALAWNAYYGGRELRCLKANLPIPIRVEGTPWR